MTDPDDPRSSTPPNAPQALAQLLEAKRRQLLAYIDRRMSDSLRSKVEVLDIYQETAIAALNAWPTLDLSGRDPFGWLCQVAEQRIVDAARKFGARKRSSEREVSLNYKATDASRELIELLAASLTTPSQVVARDDRQARLQAAVAQLPAESRDVLRWRYAEGLPTKEIAARVGKSDGAVRVLLTRTVHKLQQLLETDE